MSVVVCVTYFNLATNIHFNTAYIDVQNSCLLYHVSISTVLWVQINWSHTYKQQT